MGNFIVFILILFVLAALLRIDFFFTIVYLMIGVYVATRFWARRMLTRLIFSRRLPTRAFLGEEITVTLTLENLSMLPVPWLMLNDSFSPVLSTPPFYRQLVTLPGKGRHATHYTLHARRRGYYQVGPLLLESSDLLAIIPRLTRQLEPSELIVYPKILPITRLLLPTISPQVILPTPLPLFRDTTRLTGVRPYSQGDNFRHIHWPATAATGQLLVKQFQTAIARDNVIFLNMDRVDYGRPGQADVAIELAIVAAASLANHISAIEQLPFGFSTTALDPLTERQQTFRLSSGKGQKHLMQLLEILARIEGAEESTFLKNLRRESVTLAWGSTVIIITSVESDALLNMALLLKRAGFQPTLVFIQPAAYNYPRLQRVQALGVMSFVVTGERDVDAWHTIT
ncbi:MAG: DUF58 domain-containing protein [Anaerolineales bacterium]|nr:DUF58 domain-containing protein [Anaerolineales bacterium]